MYKCGFISAGGIIAGKHVINYGKEDVEFYAVSDNNPEVLKNFANKNGIERTYADYNEMLALPELDFVVIGLPNYLHMPAAVASLKAGKHVHCEKPMAMNFEEALEMKKARDESGKILMIGLNNRFTRESQYSWYNAMLFIQNRNKYPLQLLLREILVLSNVESMMTDTGMGDKMSLVQTIKYATTVVVTLPVLLIYPFLQKYFIKGVMVGAVKG